jgi:transposase
LMRKLRPDFKTIADFRKDNRKAFRGVFRQFVLLCKGLGLVAVSRPTRFGTLDK